MKTKDKVLVIALIIVLLIASHYDYECQKEDKEAIAICMAKDTI